MKLPQGFSVLWEREGAVPGWVATLISKERNFYVK